MPAEWTDEEWMENDDDEGEEGVQGVHEQVGEKVHKKGEDEACAVDGDYVQGKVHGSKTPETTPEEALNAPEMTREEAPDEDPNAPELTSEDAVTALVESSNPEITPEEAVSAPGQSSNHELTPGKAVSIPGESLHNEITPEDALNLESNDKTKKLKGRNKVSNPNKNYGCEEDWNVTENLDKPQLNNAKSKETEDCEKYR